MLWSFEPQEPGRRLYTPPVVPASRIGGNPPSELKNARGMSSGLGPSANGPEVFYNGGPSAQGDEGASPTDSLSDATSIGVRGQGQSGLMDLVYDPILNCYYDAKTNQYFTLK